jgi:hypothetical protein
MNLKYMDLAKNNISGPIPSSLGNSTYITYINLSRNKFAGLIPLDRFDLGFNFLNGSFPSSLRSWTNIITLILRENHFTGGKPGFLAELSNLRELQLGGNLFGGKIPRSMGKLHNLFYGLNLSASKSRYILEQFIRKH